MADKSGLGHWRVLRMTAVVLVPLVLWLAYGLTSLAGADYAAHRAWAGVPLNGILLAGFLVVMFRHAQLGTEEVIEDYVHAPCIKHAALIAVRVAAFGLLAIGLVAVAVLVFGG